MNARRIAKLTEHAMEAIKSLKKNTRGWPGNLFARITR